MDEKRTGMPAFVRMVLTLTDVTEFLPLKLDGDARERG